MLLPSSMLLGQAALLRRYFPSPTGKNALEDYVRAAGVVASPEFETYRAWEISLAHTLDTPTIRTSLPGTAAPPLA